MTLPRVITQPLGGPPLALAAQRGELRDWYSARPANAREWRDYLHLVADTHATGAWLTTLLPAIDAGGVARERLERAAKEHGVVVSTGQQAALFGGPLYTLTKALSALALSNVLQRETGIATAPIFWAATDDADYEEAAGTAVAIPGGLRYLRLPEPARPGVTMNELPMPGVERLVAELADACGSAVDPLPLEIVRQFYTSQLTLGGAYVRQLRGLLEPLGIAVLDASHPAVRRAAQPLLVRALDVAPELERALHQRYDAIRSAGYTPQVEPVPGLSLVFAEVPREHKRRVSLPDAATGQYKTLTLAPNVLLRPIVERFIMPSAAYVAGPGELAYFAQVSAAAAALDLPTPLALPRWSATIVEPRVERLLAKLGVSMEELKDQQRVETQIAREILPSAVTDALRRLRHDLEADVAALEVADGDELVPPASLQGLRRSLLHKLERVERRYSAAMKRRETELMRDVATAAGALYPAGKRQERVLNFVPFLARYGSPLVELMQGEAEMQASTIVGAQASARVQPVAERV